MSEVRETLVKQEIEQNEFMKKVDKNEKELKSLGEQEYRLNQDRISLKFGLKFKYIKLKKIFSHFYLFYNNINLCIHINFIFMLRCFLHFDSFLTSDLKNRHVSRLF